MTIPAFQEITLPFLQLAADGEVRTMITVRTQLARHFNLTPAEEAEMLPSGRQGRFANRVAWAKIYLERGGLLSSPGRGQTRITERGLEILANPPPLIDIKFLENFPEFLAFRARNSESAAAPVEVAGSETPEEALEAAYQRINAGLASELLERVKAMPQRFFEQHVIELLLRMGYRRNGANTEAECKSGDDGLDDICGVLAEDQLGLEVVYLQARVSETTIGRPEIQKFVGALHDRRAHKGVFITTGSFSPDAVRYVGSIDPRVALIDGAELVKFMIRFNVGVASSRTYEVKRIDSEYFEEM